MKKTPATPVNPVIQTIEKAILDIQILAGDLDQTNMDRLAYPPLGLGAEGQCPAELHSK